MPLPLILAALWRMRRGLVLAMLLGWAGGAALVLLAPRAHVARLVVAPAETTSFAVSSLLSPMPFPAASLLDTRPAGNFAIYLGSLRSPEAAAMLVAETALPAALAAERAEGPAGALRALLGTGRAPDADDVLDWLTRRLAATQSLASVTWTVEIAHPDPALALDMLRRLHRFAEAKVRADLADQANRRVAALERRLAEERDLFLRNSLYDLLAQQQRAAMVVAADESVSARLVSAPMVEARPSQPNRPLLLALLAVAAPLGVLLGGAALVLLRHRPPATPEQEAIAAVAAAAAGRPAAEAGRRRNRLLAVAAARPPPPGPPVPGA
jgi:hypothetical protein